MTQQVNTNAGISMKQLIAKKSSPKIPIFNNFSISGNITINIVKKSSSVANNAIANLRKRTFKVNCYVLRFMKNQLKLLKKCSNTLENIHTIAFSYQINFKNCYNQMKFVFL